jgi:hypothetical protein
MRSASFIYVLMLGLPGLPAAGASPMTLPPRTASSPSSATQGQQTVDRIAARIEDDIIMESDVRELAGFQEVVDGHSKSRDELIRELAGEWIVRGEADAAKYPQPTKDDIENAYSRLAGQFASREEFQKRMAKAKLSEAAVRRELGQQLYLSRFLDYRFRPSAQVDQQQIETYYSEEFASQLKARGQAVPPLDAVADTIREVLVQRAISDRATQWIDETRAGLRIDVIPDGSEP